ncbi:MAG: GNAT family N-acetyltransferase [Bacteroidetes bacterium]|nr:GNAT family N-acetyltransferase [Bacteroidota bacterium]
MKADDVIIRTAEKRDMHAVLDLITELAVYENARDQVRNSTNQLIEDGFGNNPAFECLVAESASHGIIGFALFFTTYSTWRGKCLYLEDLCVTEKFRRAGAGKKLFDRVLQIATERGMKRLSWQVLEWNTPAIAFYKKYKASLDPEWVNGKLVLD